MKSIYYKGIPLSYCSVGNGTTIVLLHGFLENKNMWNDFTKHFSHKHQIICIDLLGHGLTGCLGYVHTMEDQADMVHHLLTELGVRNTIMVGHSMGGYVALAFAELFPEYVKGLVLVNSTAKADSPERKENRERAIKAVKEDFRIFVRLSISNLFSEDNRQKMTSEIREVQKQALETPLQGIIAALEGMKIRKNREVLLHSTAYPKLLVLGKKDSVLNFTENETQIEGTSVDIAALEGGHMSHIENPEELIEIVSQYLRRF